MDPRPRGWSAGSAASGADHDGWAGPRARRAGFQSARRCSIRFVVVRFPGVAIRMHHGRSSGGPRCRLAVILLGGLLVGSAAETRGIEMFTFFGDGSRIGLPNLEVPVEAYPGIPLRSDRLRARRRAMRQPPAQSGQLPAGVTIRSMPAAQPTPPPRQAPAAVRPVAPRGRPVASRPTTAAPIAPLPEDVMPPRGEAE